jgi:soluble P-type ATPase
VIRVERPGEVPLHLTHAILDFNGTLARDGDLEAPLVPLLGSLAQRVTCIILSADTYGTVDRAAKVLGIEALRVRSGDEKAKVLTDLRRSGDGAPGIVAVGNGRNDVGMFRVADLALAVAGPEGLSVAALLAADVVARSPAEALELLLHPARLTATLRP